MTASTMTLSQIIFAANDLTVEQQLALNKALCEMIKTKRRQTQAVIGAGFKIGQVVRFVTKSGQAKHIKIQKFNRACTSVVGFEVDEKGNSQPLSTRWTVANSFCKVVG